MEVPKIISKLKTVLSTYFFKWKMTTYQDQIRTGTGKMKVLGVLEMGFQRATYNTRYAVIWQITTVATLEEINKTTIKPLQTEIKC